MTILLLNKLLFSFAKWILSAYQKEANEKVCCSIMDALTEV